MKIISFWMKAGVNQKLWLLCIECRSPEIPNISIFEFQIKDSLWYSYSQVSMGVHNISGLAHDNLFAYRCVYIAQPHKLRDANIHFLKAYLLGS